MQSLYEKDKMFALQYLAVSQISSKISYRSSQEDEHHEQSSLQNKRKQKNTDASANSAIINIIEQCVGVLSLSARDRIHT